MIAYRLLTSSTGKSVRSLLCAIPLAIPLLLVACGDAQESGSLSSGQDTSASRIAQARESLDQSSVETLSAAQQAAVHELMSRYLQRASADFDVARTALQSLQSAVTDLLAAPDAAALEAARSAWLAALNAYEATLLHRYYAELVLPEQDYLQLVQLDYRVNQWPILPGYIDAVANYPDSGLVFDPSVAIDSVTLSEIHGQFDIAEASLGFHVLEFLLWGDSPNLGAARGAGDFLAEQSLTDEQDDSGLPVDQLPNNRRRQLLQQVTAILNSDYAAIQQIWNTHVADFQRSANDQTASSLVSQLLQAVNGMLTEELLVRSLYPLLNRNYSESLQSPYSGATESNVVAQTSSVENLLLEISTIDGVRLDTLFSEISEDFGELFYQNFDANKECLVLLYSTISEPDTPEAAMAVEFEIVECINLLTNMIEHFTRIDQQLSGF